MFDKAINSVKSKFNEIVKCNTKFIIKGREFNQERLIAEGGYGYVYEVSDSRNQRYALKKMNVISNNHLTNIKREISLWSKANTSPNIIRLLDYEINSEYVYILMELCTQGSLLDYINNFNGSITEREALHMIKEILTGLLSLHSQSPPIAHRDIKIDNVLKFNDTYKLCDFGSASIDTMDPKNETKASMMDKFAIFEKNTTFIYRPPEMCDEYSKFIVNEKVDVWAVGCILYTVLFKTHPFQDAQKLTITTAHYFIPDESNLYSAKVIDLIRLMLTPNPINRPSVSKVLEMIRGWTGIQSIDLPLEVQEIKAKQLKVIKERNEARKEISPDDLMKAKASIMKDMKKKNKYKKKDDDFDDLFDDGDEYYKANPEKKEYNQMRQVKLQQEEKQNVGDTGSAMLFDFNSGFNNNNNNNYQSQKQTNDLGFDFDNGMGNQQQYKGNYSQNVGFDFTKANNTNSNNINNGNQFNFDMNFPQQNKPIQYQPLPQPQPQYQVMNSNPNPNQYLQHKQYQQNLQYQTQIQPMPQPQYPSYINQPQPQPQPQIESQYNKDQLNQKNQNILDFFK